MHVIIPKIAHVVTDVMGTTTPQTKIDEHDAYLRRRGTPLIERALQTGNEEMISIVERARTFIAETDPNAQVSTTPLLVQYVAEQIANKNMRPPYMDLSGNVAMVGYQTEEIEREFFEDVAPAFNRWTANNIGIWVYSTGSKNVQRTMFTTEKDGRLARYVKDFIDTDKTRGAGSKTERKSYERLCEILGADPEKVVWLSDNEEEVERSLEASLNGMLVYRQKGNVPEREYPVITNFDEIELVPLQKS